MTSRFALYAWGLLTLATVALAFAGCGRNGGHAAAPLPAARQPGPLRIVVSIPPLEGLARALAPPDAKITTLIQPGRSEHGYELTPADRAALAQADLVVYVGLNLEPPIEAFVRGKPPRVAVVCFATAVGEDKALQPPPHAEPAAAEDHDDAGGHHGHGLVDPHLWLDPALVSKFLPGLSAAISRAAIAAGAEPTGEHERARRALEAVIARVEETDAAYRRELMPFADRALVTEHAAWARLTERYHLKVAAVIRPVETVEPTFAQVARAVKAIKEQGATAVFVEPQFEAAAARRIAEDTGARVGTLDPLGGGDWFGLMRQNLDELVKTLADKPR